MPNPQRVIQQSVPFLLFRQPLEFLAAWEVGRDKRLLAVQDPRVWRVDVVSVLDVEVIERHDDGASESRVRIIVKVRVGQVQDFWLMAVQFDQVGPLDDANVVRGAAFVHAENRRRRRNAACVYVERIGRQLAARGRNACRTPSEPASVQHPTRPRASTRRCRVVLNHRMLVANAGSSHGSDRYLADRIRINQLRSFSSECLLTSDTIWSQ